MLPQETLDLTVPDTLKKDEADLSGEGLLASSLREDRFRQGTSCNGSRQ